MDKVRIAIIIAFCTVVSECLAQYTEKVWCFGDSAGIDFNQVPPVPIKSSVKARGACTTICDNNGNLLLYATNFNYNFWSMPGTSSQLGIVFNSDHELVYSGDSINSRSWYNELLLVNAPSDSNKFYLFHMGVTTGLFPGLFYSTIEKNYNNGQGRVVDKNVQLDSLQNCDGIHAVKHANGRDWWIVTKSWATANNTYSIFLLSPAGVSLFAKQNIGSATMSSFYRIKFNHDGGKMIALSANGLIELFDFDRCAGTLSNPVIIDTERTTAPVPLYWGVEFSPSGNMLYVSTSASTSGLSVDTFSVLMQFNLGAPNIFTSMVMLDTIHFPYRAGLLELGPDDRIYFSSRFDDPNFSDFFYHDTVNLFKVKHVSVIHAPNMLGSACDYRRYSFYLGGERTYYGLPNNPNYSAGAIPGTVCDSLGLGIGDIKQGKFFVNVYPNPVLNTASIVVNAPPNLRLDDLRLEIYDTMGRQVRSTYLGSERAYTFKRGNLSSGSYCYRLYSEKGGVVSGKLFLQ